MEERAPKNEFLCAFTGKDTKFSILFIIWIPPLYLSNKRNDMERITYSIYSSQYQSPDALFGKKAVKKIYFQCINSDSLVKLCNVKEPPPLMLQKIKIILILPGG